jgi:DNA-binding transcriptional ArsR family regulator
LLPSISELREMTEPPLEKTVEIFKALAHPARLRLLGMLRSGSLCVCQATAALELAVSTVSAHLAELKRAGLVVERRDGRWVSYSLADDAAAAELRQQVFALMPRDAQLASDERLVRSLRRLRVEELCRVNLDFTRLGLRRQPARQTGRNA